MKKLILIPIIFLFSQCEIKMKPVNAQRGRGANPNSSIIVNALKNDYNNDFMISSFDEYRDGVHRRIYTGTTGSPYGAVVINVVNITKDSLECEYYKKLLK